MGSPALQSMKVEVEQAAVGGPVDTKLPAKVYGSPPVAVEEDHMASLQAECTPGGTWVECH
jgi:hypothetical protein